MTSKEDLVSMAKPPTMQAVAMQIDENSKITDLLDKAKAAIEQGESSLRKAAEYIAQAQDEGATQKQIAGRIGRS